MTNELITVLILLLACMVLFIANKPRMDVVALLMLMALPLTGILTVDETMAGFSDANVILIALLFVIGEGLVRTGIALQMGDVLLARSGKSETRLIIYLMLTVAGLGAFMSSTGVVAIFIPVVLGVAARIKVPPGRLLMPLSFAGLISGMLTLVATPPNLILDSALERGGHERLSFFSFTPIGLAVLAAGTVYMLFARNWIQRSSDEDPANQPPQRGIKQFIQEYRLADTGCSLRIRKSSPLIGRTLKQSELRSRYAINVVAIQRRTRFQLELVNPTAQTEIKADDLLMVDLSKAEPLSKETLKEIGAKAIDLRGNYFTDQSREVGMAEILVPPDSDLIGKTLYDIRFRSRHGLTVIGIRRQGEIINHDVHAVKLRLGDVLLVIGPWASIRRLQLKHKNFVVLTLPAESELAAPSLKQAPFAILSIIIMVVLMVTGIVPNVLAALIACLFMGATGCLTMNSAYKSIHWQSLIVIVGMMPFAVALQKTGGVQIAVEGFLSVFRDTPPRALLAGLFALTSFIGVFISNTATAVLMAPIALSIAAQIGASPVPFAITVAMAASSAFMAPISSPVNMLVYTPGNYRFTDFLRVGVPFTLLVLIITIVLVPVLFPF